MAFKRGFLNSKKGRDALATDSPPSRSASESKSAKSAIETAQKDSSSIPSDSTPSGLPSASVEEPKRSEIPLDLHSPPPGHSYDPGKTRFIFRQWPRAPDGQVIRKEHPEYGKRTSNGYPIWGETLYDFYRTYRIPTLPNLVTSSSGSRLAAWMRSFGELDAAADELAWANSEGDPKQIFPCDVGQLIRDYERNTAGLDPTNDFAKLLLSRTPKLQARIPFHLLPEKLIVHDPWNTLSVDNVRDDEDASETDKEGIVHIFELSLSEEGKQKQVAEREAAEAADKARMEKEEDEWRITMPFLDKPGPLEPDQFATYAKVPPRPARPTSIPEAHLYIRREDKCGAGNHSVVYFSELELPRWALVDDVLCEACYQTAFEQEFDERSKAGTLLLEDAKGKGKPAEIKRTKVVIDDRSDVVLVSEPVNTPNPLLSAQPDVKRDIQYMRSTPREVFTDEYTGPIAFLYPQVAWQNPAYGPVCEHLRVGGRDPPLTARVKVCAKLSIQGDLHLAREGENYQAFPSYFSEHWNGYNVLQPLHDPTPCGALVPQFYGYYVPQGGFTPVVNEVVPDPGPASDSASESEVVSRLPADYISPILLLEHCGVPIQLGDLSEDDRNTCAALYFHFMEGGWTQNSMAERNVVVQPGPISDWPVFRGQDRRQRSFRLIDFGRAAPLGESMEYAVTKSDILKLFELFHHSRH
ncbi:hypothetical protein PENSPDRAFT_597002 [Peniophora sp. CONT]|nr:hypothetical protein PENSPDRAFT_597002 [Peniophora sp. CONT]